MPYFSDRLTSCIGLGLLFGLVCFFVTLLFFSHYIKLQNANRQLELDTLTDQLTGLLNRRALECDLEHLKQDKVYSCLFIDIDNFRDFNNKFGHEVGDRILKKIGTTIKNAVRQQDRVYRYGGEELIVLLESCIKVDAIHIAEKIHSKVNAVKEGDYPRITLSIGVSSYPFDGKDIKSLIEGSDMAMLTAKQRGKNCTVAC